MTDRSVLEDRARDLAAPLVELSDGAAGDATLVIRRGSERFGIPLDAVVEVQRGPSMTPLPTAAAPVVGVIGWRGRILTVIDIAASGASIGADTEWRAVIVGRSRARIAIFADAVDETRVIEAGEIRPPDEVALRSEHAPLRGITADALIVLDGEALLSRYSA
ncbi:MAG TPA: chemotaxis protein CheW [Gemmatimonadaceae bacterium]|nr:chemotaxis protein CheW [Gemmatimonadaceae bacterium]